MVSNFAYAMNIHDSLELASPGAETPGWVLGCTPTPLLSPRLPLPLCPPSLCSQTWDQLSQGYILRRHDRSTKLYIVWGERTTALGSQSRSAGGSSELTFWRDLAFGGTWLGHHPTASHMKSPAYSHCGFPSLPKMKIPLCLKALAYAVPSGTLFAQLPLHQTNFHSIFPMSAQWSLSQKKLLSPFFPIELVYCSC